MSSAPRRLRVGVLLDSFQKPRWVADVLERVAASAHAELAAVLVAPSTHAAAPRGVPARLRSLWPERRDLLYRLYSAVDRRLFGRAGDPFGRVDLSDRLGELSRVDLEVRSKRFSDVVGEASVDAVRALELDVILRFGLRIVRGGILDAARYGMWSFHHGDNLINRGGPPAFWEVILGEPVTGTVLQILSEDLDAGRVLERMWTATDKTSVARNKHRVYWKSTRMVERALRRLAEEGLESFDDDIAELTFSPYDRQLYRKPSNAQCIGPLLRFAGRTVRRKVVEKLRHRHWFFAYGFGKAEGPATRYDQFKKVFTPTDRFWADPFPVEHEGRYFIFVEELPYRTGKGHISVAEVVDGELGPMRPVLETPYHLSYPFVFTWKGEHWMLPESSRNRTVELYRAVRFPDEWVLEKVLLEDTTMVDATLHQEDGRWWMFASPGEQAASKHDELHLFSAPDPLGPWTPHRRNPVQSDPRCSRPAGRLFRYKGGLYRPAQDCAERYGHAIDIRRVLRLDDDAYEEAPASRIEPRWTPGLIATHTLNHAGRLTVIDGMWRGWKWRRPGS